MSRVAIGLFGLAQVACIGLLCWQQYQPRVVYTDTVVVNACPLKVPRRGFPV